MARGCFRFRRQSPRNREIASAFSPHFDAAWIVDNKVVEHEKAHGMSASSSICRRYSAISPFQEVLSRIGQESVPAGIIRRLKEAADAADTRVREVASSRAPKVCSLS